MIGKFHKMKTYIITGAFFAFINQAAYSAETQCFPTIEAYMNKSYGESYKDDENISVREEKYGKNIFYFVVDKTSGTNYGRSLLREKTAGEFCLVLSTQPVAQLVPGMPDELGVPQKFVATDQAPPGMPEHEITYILNKGDFRYDAKNCKEISWINKKRKTKTISCRKLLEK
jgi:hypothetical protein